MKVLFAGESWIEIKTEIKGIDQFIQTFYGEEVGLIRSALEKDGIELVHIPSHLVQGTFPTTAEELKSYDAVMVSDVGANSFLLSTATAQRSEIAPNRLDVLKNYVNAGGGFCMIGGYMTFMGIDGKARYKGTSIEEMLPVQMLDGDDRCEVPEGVKITIEVPEHPVFTGIQGEWPLFLGYNKLTAKPGCLLASHRGNAFIASWEYGKGRALAFASDCAPHWAPPAFVNWTYYSKFWCNVVKYLAKAI